MAKTSGVPAQPTTSHPAFKTALKHRRLNAVAPMKNTLMSSPPLWEHGKIRFQIVLASPGFVKDAEGPYQLLVISVESWNRSYYATTSEVKTRVCFSLWRPHTAPTP